MISAQTLERLACDAGLTPVVKDEDGTLLNVGRHTRSISPALKRALCVRDRHCRFPGCDHHEFLEGHHIEHWAQGGETKISNLVLLCHFHHHLIHEGAFCVESSDKHFAFTRPNGRLIERPPIVVEDDPITKLAKREGILEPIDPENLRPLGGGESYDHHLAVEDLFPDELMRRRLNQDFN